VKAIEQLEKERIREEKERIREEKERTKAEKLTKKPGEKHGIIIETNEGEKKNKPENKEEKSKKPSESED